MTKNRHIAALLLAALTFAQVSAQNNGSNSSYSRFGLGTINDQSTSFNKAMGGVGKAIRISNRVNTSNPASYSAIDSLTMIIDAGMTMSTGRLKSGEARIRANNCSFDYVNAGFRLRKGLGFSIGMLPYTTIGYSFATSQKVTNDFSSTQAITSHSSYYGEGGLHQIYMGVGWNPFADLSIGANINYVWGNYTHNLSQTFDENGTVSSNYSGLNSTHNADIRTYKIDLGVQYPIIIDEQNRLTVGATTSLGHNIKGDASLVRYNTVGDSINIVAKNAFDLPYTMGGGLAWEHSGRLLVAADYTYEKWGDCKTPQMSTEGGLSYTAKKGGYMNRSKISAGAQYTPDPLSNNFFNRVHYRFGAHYSTPYLKVNGHDGPSEYGITAGVGLPISNSINRGPMANISLQWLRRDPKASGMITEDYFLVSLGVTFAESWFMKFKIR